MTKSRCISVRLSRNQIERVKANANSKGYESIAQYARSKMLEHDSANERKLDEIHKEVVVKNGKK